MKTLQHTPSFSGGEQTPLLSARVDLARFQTSLKTIMNCIVLPWGGLSRRPGSRHIDAAPGAGRLIPFVFSATDSLILEVTDLLFRFYKNDGIVLDGTPVEVVHPWSLAELAEVWYAQVGDLVYFTRAGHETKKLSRTSDIDWTLIDVDWEDGPFERQNIDEAKKITASAASGSGITLTASGFTFDDDHLGSIWHFREGDFSLIQKWEGEVMYSINKQVRVGGRVYEVIIVGDDTDPANPNGGANAPDHTSGDEKAGEGRVTWRFIHDEFGIAKITAVAGGGATATADVIHRLPDSVATGGIGTWRWSEGSWSTLRGFPEVIAFSEQRLLAAKTKTAPTQIWASVSADFENHGSGPNADDAIPYVLANLDNQASAILWIADGRRLQIGTGSMEFVNLSNSLADVPDFKGLTAEGAAAHRPVRVQGPVVFLTADRKRLMDFVFDIRQDQNIPDEISLLAEHLLKPGVVELCYQKRPWKTIWAVLTDGMLIGCTFIRNQEFVAFHQHQLGGGGKVISAAVKPTSDGTSDELWMLVERVIDSVTVYHVERLEQPDDPVVLTSFDDVWHLDAALKYDGAAKTIFSGLDHLEGETVQVLADGVARGDHTVSGGEITLAKPASKVLVGLNEPAFVVSLPPEFEFQEGVTTGKRKRARKIEVHLLASTGITVGRENDPNPQLLAPMGGKIMDAAPLPKSGSLQATLSTGFKKGQSIDVRQPGPHPLTVLEFTIEWEVAA